MSLKKLYYLLLSCLVFAWLSACGNSGDTISYKEIEYGESATETTDYQTTSTVEGSTISDAENAEPQSQEEATKEQDLYISVLGEVISPGVYILPKGSRVYEAINMAGGVTENANVYVLNLVMELEDGVQIVVPSLDEESLLQGYGLSENTEETDGKININKASLAELKTLTGIGDVRAQAIIDYREKTGPFNEIEDLLKVNGIKESTFDKIKDSVCVK